MGESSNSNPRYTFEDVLHAARNRQQFDYGFWMDLLCAQVMKYFGFCLVGVAVLVISGLGYLGLFVVLPTVTEPWSLLHLVNAAAGIFVIFNIFFNYFYAIFTDPGSPVKDEDGVQNENLASTNWQYRECKKCNVIKPPRAHHCSMCERCTLRMDHHCPWINNCVGLHNYRYFVTFLIWTSIGTLYLTLLVVPEVMHVARTELSTPSPLVPVGFRAATSEELVGENSAAKVSKGGLRGWSEFYQFLQVVGTDSHEHPRRQARAGTANGSSLSPLAQENQKPRPTSEPVSILWVFARPRLFGELLRNFPDDKISHLLTFFVSVGVHVAVSSLMFFHIYLGQTTLEFYANMNRPRSQSNTSDQSSRAHPYDKGYRKNFEEVFGPYPWYIAILPSTRTVSFEEQSYPRRRADTGYGSVLDV